MSEETVHLRSAGAPNGVGKYWWSDSSAVVAVDNKTAQQLLHIPQGGFSVAERYDARPPAAKKPVVVEEPKKLVEAPIVVVTPEPPEMNNLDSALDLVSPKGSRSRKA